jgi:S-DNA-T family DNA segregation ATPase FtsK/SpoIIIE
LALPKSEYLLIITLLISIFLFFFSSELKFKSIFLFISKFFSFFSKYKKTQNIESEKIIQNENSIIEKKQQDLPFKYAEEKNILEKINFKLPSISFLEKNLESKLRSDNKNQNSKNAEFLEKILLDFDVKGKIKGISHGPVVTLNEFEPSPGIKVSKIINLAEDIARNTSSVSTRVSTIPGKNTVGIEIPNEKRDDVYLREIIQDKKFSNQDIKLPIALGKSISGIPIVGDLSAMPHLLIAGTTGSGKSVCINTIIVSLLYKHTPENCKFILIDPKMLELSSYEGIPHLLSPVITEPKKATSALRWVVKEMENRYRKMTEIGVRNIDGFNSKFKEKMPYIVVIVDEMSDLMLVAGKEIENYIQKLSQMARAAGIHIIMATQRPSVDVITGTIKANFPTRISFQVSSKIDSRTILGEQGAEQLLGKGDMLFMSSANRIIRIHGPYIGENEIEKINTFLRTQAKPSYLDEITNFSKDSDAINKISDNDKDELYEKAIMLIKNEGKASTSFLQRKLQIGYNRAARIIDMMEEDGIVGQPNHVGKREVL